MVGDLVRVVDLEVFGRHGVVTGKLVTRRLSIGTSCLIAPVTLDDGLVVEVPAANLELLSPAGEGPKGR